MVETRDSRICYLPVQVEPSEASGRVMLGFKTPRRGAVHYCSGVYPAASMAQPTPNPRVCFNLVCLPSGHFPQPLRPHSFLCNNVLTVLEMGEDEPWKTLQGRPWWSWLRAHLSMQEAWVQLPVGEFRSRRLMGQLSPGHLAGSPLTPWQRLERPKRKRSQAFLFPGVRSCTATPQPGGPHLKMLPLEATQVVSSQLN